MNNVKLLTDQEMLDICGGEMNVFASGLLSDLNSYQEIEGIPAGQWYVQVSENVYGFGHVSSNSPGNAADADRHGGPYNSPTF